MSGFKIIVYRLRGVFRDIVRGPIQPAGDRFGYFSATIMPMMHGLMRAMADYRLATRLDTALRPSARKNSTRELKEKEDGLINKRRADGVRSTNF